MNADERRYTKQLATDEHGSKARIAPISEMLSFGKRNFMLLVNSTPNESQATQNSVGVLLSKKLVLPQVGTERVGPMNDPFSSVLSVASCLEYLRSSAFICG
jgi:hypothetical protein